VPRLTCDVPSALAIRDGMLQAWAPSACMQPPPKVSTFLARILAVPCRTKREIEAVHVDERILEDQIDVRGGYRKPKLTEMPIVQIWFLPYYAYTALAWQWRWFYKYQIQKQEYAQEDKEYLTRTFQSISAHTWEGLDDKVKGRYMADEIWIPEKEAAYRQREKEWARKNKTFGDIIDE
jgi:hypothetical protein